MDIIELIELLEQYKYEKLVAFVNCGKLKVIDYIKTDNKINKKIDNNKKENIIYTIHVEKIKFDYIKQYVIGWGITTSDAFINAAFNMGYFLRLLPEDAENLIIGITHRLAIQKQSLSSLMNSFVTEEMNSFNEGADHLREFLGFTSPIHQ